MAIASHVIFSAYGFWLPNDPRGSWSTYVASWELFRYGPVIAANTRQSIAAKPHDAQRRISAKTKLLHAPVIFSGGEALAISRGFATAINESGYSLLACAILPDHVHAIVAWNARDARRIVGHLKTAARMQLVAEGFSRFATPWARGCWTVYLNSAEDTQRAIRYVEDNPLKEGKKRQRWSFVTPYE